jgi:predicted glutamine amidotransferase
MCGFVGFINREKTFANNPLVKYFGQGLLCDSLRGKHGTGVLGVDAKGVASVYKRALAASDFLELTPAKKIIESNSNVFMVGHNRWATRGTHTSENTHPFTHDHITLFHNGTIDYYQSLNKGMSFDVDSDAVAHYLANSPDTIQALENLEGTYSLVWYDETLETLNFARSKDKPMFFGKVKGTGSVVFASESGMLRWLSSRNGIELETIFETKEGLWIQVPLDGEEAITSLPFKPKEKEVVHHYYGRVHHQPQKEEQKEQSKEKGLVTGSVVSGKVTEWIPYNSTTNISNKNGYLVVKISDTFHVNLPGYGESVISSYLGKQVKLRINNVVSSEMGYGTFLSFENVIVVIGKKYKGPHNKLVSLEEFNKLVDGGCSCCSETISPDDHEDIDWDDDGTVYCPTCTSFIQRYGSGV